MFGQFLVRLFGSRNEREIKSMLSSVEEINRLEPEMQQLPDKALSAKTDEFRNRLSDAFHGKDVSRREMDRELDKMLPEAFAVVREASRRVVITPDADNPQPMRHFDVQLIGGIVLHRGTIAEMVTGEGKTLVATLAVYLNALPGKGVHIVTVNDFLARRDRDWMGPLYEFLGLTAGAIQNQQDYESKRAAYQCDITFGKDSEFGFDFLRDNMRWSVEEQVQQRGLYYAIVDEVDSVLIDEARTPLIISGPSEESTDKYYAADRVARRLKKNEDFIIKEKEQSAHLTESGIAAAEKALGVDSIYTGRNAEWPHHIEQSLRAHHLFKSDDEYMVKGGEIIIVDEFTGRLMPGRRWSDGLHQAIEAKEGLRIKEEDQTLATVTYQNLFRMYQKLAGMTGTAMTEATEFDKIYRLDVLNLPTNRPLIRAEYPDVVYCTAKEKYDAIEEEIVEQHATGRPVLVGTVSIEKSEVLSDRLKRRGIKHEVLNAKHHEREAQIIAQAGKMGHVTIATNMAGRGTDIVLGAFKPEELIEHWKARGLAPKDPRADLPPAEMQKRLTEYWAQHFLDEETIEKTPREQWGEELEKFRQRNRMPRLRLCDTVAKLGGLHIVGTERHEARRIDNQLRGRSGRQGDPGSSRFFLSLQDDLMRIFASDRVSSILRSIGMKDGMAIEHGLVTRSIQRAQKKVEERNFEIRKHLLEYDEVMDEQRRAIYKLRQQILEHGDLKRLIRDMIEGCLSDDLNDFVPTDTTPEDRNGRVFYDWARTRGVSIEVDEWLERDRSGLKELFRSRKSTEWTKAPLDQIVTDCVTAAMDLFMDSETLFVRWNLTGLSRWARHIRVAAEAEEMRDSVFTRILTHVEKAAIEQHKETPQDAAVEILLEQAIETYIAGAVAVEEWNVHGLSGWADAVGISVPVGQWQHLADEDEQEGDSLARRLDSVREQLRERLGRALRNQEPSLLIAKVTRYEFRRRVEQLGEDTDGQLRKVLSWTEHSLAVSVPESSMLEQIAAERRSIQGSLSRQLKEKLSAKSLDEAIGFCAHNMVDTFLALDLAAPKRNFIGLHEAVARKYGVQLDPFELSKLAPDALGRTILDRVKDAYARREEQVGPERMRTIERYILLQKIDTKWKDHLLAMDHLKGGIGLRGYAQQDPKVEYTREARTLFDDMQSSVRKEVTDLILRMEIQGEEDSGGAGIWSGGEATHPDARQAASASQRSGDIRKQQTAAIAGTERGEKPEPIRAARRVGRNDPCPCGSGKKYKKCCGRAG